MARLPAPIKYAASPTCSATGSARFTTTWRAWSWEAQLCASASRWVAAGGSQHVRCTRRMACSCRPVCRSPAVDAACRRPISIGSCASPLRCTHRQSSRAVPLDHHCCSAGGTSCSASLSQTAGPAEPACSDTKRGGGRRDSGSGKSGHGTRGGGVDRMASQRPTLRTRRKRGRQRRRSRERRGRSKVGKQLW